MPAPTYTDIDIAKILIGNGGRINQTRELTGISYSRCKAVLDQVTAGNYDHVKNEILIYQALSLGEQVEHAAMNLARQIALFRVGRHKAETAREMTISLVLLTRELKAIRNLDGKNVKGDTAPSAASVLGNLSKDKLKQLASVVEELMGTAIPEVSDLAEPVIYSDTEPL